MGKKITKENASEMGRKGGTNKRGSVSIKRALIRELRNGIYSADDVAKSLIQGCIEKNPTMAKLVISYIDGLPENSISIKGGGTANIQLLPVSPVAEELRLLRQSLNDSGNYDAHRSP